MKKNHLGSTLDDFLKEDRLLDAVQATDKNTVQTRSELPVHRVRAPATESHLPLGVMMIRIEKARYVSDYKLWLRFSDGAEGEVDLQNQLDGEVFEPLKDTQTPDDPKLIRGSRLRASRHFQLPET